MFSIFGYRLISLPEREGGVLKVVFAPEGLLARQGSRFLQSFFGVHWKSQSDAPRRGQVLLELLCHVVRYLLRRFVFGLHSLNNDRPFVFDLGFLQSGIHGLNVVVDIDPWERLHPNFFFAWRTQEGQGLGHLHVLNIMRSTLVRQVLKNVRILRRWLYLLG